MASLPAIGHALSVLTYNVEGLPWPIASGRPDNLAAIADRLKYLRARGQAPKVVVLQEAFTKDARSIGQKAGYRYIVDGPSSDHAAPAGMNTVDPTFAAAARWWSGETEGKMLGSGLQLLSDYPIVEVRRMVFPAGDCAGYDCLANKGAMLVRVAVPGLTTPVDIVTTHLNSRAASGVAKSRADQAYARQVDLLTGFVEHARDPRNPLIVAGDFNMGKTPVRRAALFGQIEQRWSVAGSVRNALGQAVQDRLPMPQDAVATARRAKDWQFFAPGHAAALELTGISVPFGREPNGDMLSDHVGYIAYFRQSAQ
ncbi:endonuclease/exonuclease/phosphatase family protein [Sphingomonas aliaeris]|nr:endonuclease/exonuclease/phosphatase family protein [Sphingomonas aliaeris]